MNTKVSIVIPIYGVERFVFAALESCMLQTFQAWDAICVDDGSPDKSGLIADEFARHDTRFRVIHKRNRGVSSARNYGLRYIYGEYLFFFDPDDLLFANALERFVAILENNKDIDCVKGRYIRVPESFPIQRLNKLEQEEYARTEIKGGGAIGHHELVDEMIKTGVSGRFTSELHQYFFRKTSFNYLFNEGLRFFEDVEVMWIYLLRIEKIFCIDIFTVAYRSRKGSLINPGSTGFLGDIEKRLKLIEICVNVYEPIIKEASLFLEINEQEGVKGALSSHVLPFVISILKRPWASVFWLTRFDTDLRRLALIGIDLNIPSFYRLIHLCLSVLNKVCRPIIFI